MEVSQRIHFWCQILPKMMIAVYRMNLLKSKQKFLLQIVRMTRQGIYACWEGQSRTTQKS